MSQVDQVRLDEPAVSFFRMHAPALLALAAFAVLMTTSTLIRDTSVVLNVFFGWRQCIAVAAFGVVVAGILAELIVLAVRAPVKNWRVFTVMVAVVWGVMTVLGAAFQD
jgi:hypothetical protein